MDFSLEQIKKMKDGVNPRIHSAIRIHHDYRVGRMLIVEERFHRLAHKGGAEPVVRTCGYIERIRDK